MVITTSDDGDSKSNKQLFSDICQFAPRDAATRFIKWYKHFNEISRRYIKDYISPIVTLQIFQPDSTISYKTIRVINTKIL